MSRWKSRIRILDKKPKKPSFTTRVEARARGLVHRLPTDHEPDEISAILAKEVALTLDQIDGLRKAHGEARRSLRNQELYLDTEIIQRKPRPPVYEDPRLPERDRLRDRLRAVEKERRRLLMSEEEQLRPLHDRLLSLMNRHDLTKL